MARSSRPLVRSVAVAFVIVLGAVAVGAAMAARTASTPTLTVWTDDVRAKGFEQYAKSHRGVKLDIKVVPGAGSSAEFVAKVRLAARTGNGPDVAFDGPNNVPLITDPRNSLALDLTNLVPKSVLDKFYARANGQCYVAGRLYCLKNDLAQNVLWYNAKLMKQFGYAVPTTWQEYRDIGLRVAKEHPGYIVGAFGNFYDLDNWFWTLGCTVAQVLDQTRVRINLATRGCSRMIQILDPLLAAGSVVPNSTFDSTMAKLGNEDKILMLPAASWYGEYMFKPFFKTPPGEIAAAPPLLWAGDKNARPGAQGGGLYWVSKKTKYVKQALDLIVWMSTDAKWQASSVTFPASRTGGKAWAARIAKDPYYASNPYPALEKGANEIDRSWSFVRFPLYDPFTSTVIPAVQSGKSVASQLTTYQNQLTQLATLAGYTVVK